MEFDVRCGKSEQTMPLDYDLDNKIKELTDDYFARKPWKTRGTV